MDSFLVLIYIKTLSLLFMIFWNMLTQTKSWPDKFVTMVARNGHSVQMICINVSHDVSEMSLFSTHLAHFAHVLILPLYLSFPFETKIWLVSIIDWTVPSVVSNLQRSMTQFRLMSWYESFRWVKVKVLKWCWKKWNKHNLMYICHKQCEIMHKIQVKPVGTKSQVFRKIQAGGSPKLP